MDVSGQAAAFILGIIGPVVAALGIYLSRRGQREQRDFDRWAEDYKRIKDDRDFHATDAAQQRLRAERAEDELDEQRDEWRRRHAEAEAARREAVAEQTATCRAEVERLADALQLMKGMVHSKVAQVVADQAIEAVKPHPHRDAVDEWLDAAPDLD